MHWVLTLFAAFTVACAAGVISCRNTVNAAMCLLLCLAGIAALFVRLDAFLLAFILILVYAGAVVALFLFIIMLLNVHGSEDGGPRGSRLSIAPRLVAALLIAAGLASFFLHGRLAAPPAAGVPALGASLKLYAYSLFTAYLLPVQIVGFLLLISMLGVIVLSRRHAGSGYGA